MIFPCMPPLSSKIYSQVYRFFLTFDYLFSCKFIFSVKYSKNFKGIFFKGIFFKGKFFYLNEFFLNEDFLKEIFFHIGKYF